MTTTTEITCPSCNGGGYRLDGSDPSVGYYGSDEPCDECDGEGVIELPATIRKDLPNAA